MEHPDFLVWMLFFPIMIQVVEWIRFQYMRSNQLGDDIASGIARLFVLVLWLGGGFLLW